MTYPDPQDYPSPRPQFFLKSPQVGASAVSYGKQMRMSFPSGLEVVGVSHIRDLALVEAHGSFLFWVNKSELAPRNEA